MSDFGQLYGTQNAAAAGGTVSEAGFRLTQGLLRSELLAGDPYLHAIYQGVEVMDVRTPRPINGPGVRKVQTALKIVIEALAPASEFLRQARAMTSDGYYGEETEAVVGIFQTDMGRTFSDPVGTVGAETLIELDNELQRIRFYDVGTERLLHDGSLSHPVGEYTRVLSVDVPLRKFPQLQASLTENPVVRTLNPAPVTSPTDMGRVLVIQAVPQYGVYCVETDTGERGYLAELNLYTELQMPEPGSLLYEVPQGQTGLQPLISAVYEIAGPEPQPKLEFYAYLLLAINNPASGSRQTYQRLNINSGRFDLATQANATIWYEAPGGPSVLTDLDDLVRDTLNSPTIQGLIPFADRTWAGIQRLYGGARAVGDYRLSPGQQLWVPPKACADALFILTDLNNVLSNNLSNLQTYIRTTFVTPVRNLLDAYWEVGYGFRVDSGIGATFGIPIRADLDHTFYIWRDSNTVIKMIRRGTLDVGVETGAGYGGFFGVSGPTSAIRRWVGLSDTQRKGKQYGFGMELLAQAQSGVSVTIQQEYLFDITNDEGVATMLYAMAQDPPLGSLPTNPVNPLNLPIQLGKQFLSMQKLFGLDPNKYMHKCSYSLANAASAAAQGEVGLRFGEPGERASWQNEANPLQFSSENDNAWMTRIMAIAKITLGLDVGAQIASGIDFEFKDRKVNPITGKSVPLHTKIELTFEGQFQLLGRLPLVGYLIPSIGLAPPNSQIPYNFFFNIATFLRRIGTGGGFKLILEYTAPDPTANVGDHTAVASRLLQHARYGIFIKRGDFIDSGQELSVVVNRVLPFPTNTQQLVDMLHEVKLKSRFGLSYATRNLAKWQDLSRNLGIGIKDKQIYGVFATGYLELELKTPVTPELTTKIKRILDDIVSTPPAGQSPPWEDVWHFIYDYIRLGGPPEKLPDIVCQILDLFVLEKADVHAELGASLAGQATIKAGGSIRARYLVGGSLVYHQNVTPLLQRLFAGGSRSNLAKFLISTAPQAMDTYISNLVDLRDAPKAF